MSTLAQLLADAGLPRLEAQMLLLHVLDQPTHARAWLLTHDGEPLPAAAAQRLAALAERRRAGEPIAYLVGQKAFHGLTLQVDARVLDPRDDTETLSIGRWNFYPPRPQPTPEQAQACSTWAQAAVPLPWPWPTNARTRA